MKRNLLDRKTYDVFFVEEDSKKEGMIVLNAWDKKDLKKEFKRFFKGWKIKRVRMHR